MSGVAGILGRYEIGSCPLDRSKKPVCLPMPRIFGGQSIISDGLLTPSQTHWRAVAQWRMIRKGTQPGSCWQ